MMKRCSAALLLCLPLLAGGCADSRTDSLAPPTGGSAPATRAPGVVGSDDADAAGGAVVSRSGVGGRVTTAAGAPVATATISRSPVGSRGPVTQEVVVTDADGRWFWPLPAGTWEVSITAQGLRAAAERVTVAPDRRTTLDVVLQRP